MAGNFTLATFRNGVASALGERGAGNEDLDRWVNQAYFELIGEPEFDELITTAEATLTQGTQVCLLPTGFMAMIAVVDMTNDEERLTFTDIRDFYRKDLTTEDQPEFWSRDGDSIYIQPKAPVGDIVLRIVYYKEPPALSVAADRTDLNARWDPVIMLLAQGIALQEKARNEVESQEAELKLRRARAMARTRTMDQDLEVTPSTGFGVATSFADIRKA